MQMETFAITVLLIIRAPSTIIFEPNKLAEHYDWPALCGAACVERLDFARPGTWLVEPYPTLLHACYQQDGL